MRRKRSVDAQPLAIAEGAAALLGDEDFAEGGIEHDAGDRLAMLLQRNADAEKGQPPGEIGGAVDRVDQEAPAAAGNRRFFLAEDGGIGEARGKHGGDRPFRGDVGRRLEVAGALQRQPGALMPPAEIGDRPRAGQRRLQHGGGERRGRDGGNEREIGEGHGEGLCWQWTAHPGADA